MYRIVVTYNSMLKNAFDALWSFFPIETFPPQIQIVRNKSAVFDGTIRKGPCFHTTKKVNKMMCKARKRKPSEILK